jgi:UDP-2,3-diacylglucosamine pyrophosphatase LpxH
MTTHEEILDAIVGSSGPPFLVARFVSGDLRIPGSYAAVMLPDLHLLSEAASKSYAGFFFVKDLAPKLTKLVAALNALNLDRLQLGDRYDLWRESDLGGITNFDEATVASLVTRIQADYSEVAAVLDSGRWLPLAGNHDFHLSSGYRGDDRPSTKGIRDAADWLWRGSGSAVSLDEPILVIHGHIFDPIETWIPEILHVDALHASFGRAAKPSTHSLLMSPPRILVGQRDQLTPKDVDRFVPFESAWQPAKELPLVTSEVVVNTQAPGPAFNVLEYPSLKRFWVANDVDPVAAFANASFHRSADLAALLNRPAPSLCVIGHTHQPRIVVGERYDGSRAALMDCGAWVETSTFADSSQKITVPSAHLGVIVGCDLRIYQVVATI